MKQESLVTSTFQHLSESCYWVVGVKTTVDDIVASHVSIVSDRLCADGRNGYTLK